MSNTNGCLQVDTQPASRPVRPERWGRALLRARQQAGWAPGAVVAARQGLPCPGAAAHPAALLLMV